MRRAPEKQTQKHEGKNGDQLSLGRQPSLGRQVTQVGFYCKYKHAQACVEPYLLDLVETRDDARAAVDVDEAVVLDVTADRGDPAGARYNVNQMSERNASSPMPCVMCTSGIAGRVASKGIAYDDELPQSFPPLAHPRLYSGLPAPSDLASVATMCPRWFAQPARPSVAGQRGRPLAMGQQISIVRYTYSRVRVPIVSFFLAMVLGRCRLARRG